MCVAPSSYNGELHRSRAQVSPSQRVSRACEGRRGRAGVLRRQAKSRGCEGRGGPGRCRAVKLRGNSTGPGRAGVSHRQAKGELHRAGARGCRAGVRGRGARVCRAVKLRGYKGELHRVGARGGCEGLTDSTRARHARGTRERLRTLRGRL